MDSCCICLMNIAGCHKLSELDENGIDWLKKLQMIVPELEQDSSMFVDDSLIICGCCMSQIEGIIKFKNHLIELIMQHKFQTQGNSFAGYQNESHMIELGDHSFADGNNEFEYHSSCYSKQEDSSDKQDIGPIVTLSANIIHTYLEKQGDELNTEDSLVQCIKCKESFTDQFLEIHKQGHAEEFSKDSYVCNSCCKLQTTEESFNQHKKSGCRKQNVHKKGPKKTKTNKYSCEICGLEFDYIKDVVQHCTSVHSMNEKTVKPYTCGMCSCRFTSFSNYSQHQKYHNGVRDHICSLCGKTFITKADLIVHEYIHQNRRNYKCTICEKAFNTNKNLRTHNLVVHTDHSLWKHECKVCQKRFPLKGNFDQHMKRHSGDKQYVCQVCEKTFVSGTELKRHVLLHTNIRAHACKYCNQEYKTTRTLNIHLKRAHSVGDAKLPKKERKYVCHICPSQFYDKQKLTRHLYGHSGMKPFSCSSCDKKFTDKSYLSHHLRVSHNILEN